MQCINVNAGQSISNRVVMPWDVADIRRELGNKVKLTSFTRGEYRSGVEDKACVKGL